MNYQQYNVPDTYVDLLRRELYSLEVIVRNIRILTFLDKIKYDNTIQIDTRIGNKNSSLGNIGFEGELIIIDFNKNEKYNTRRIY